jgi:hypothetical protein
MSSFRLELPCIRMGLSIGLGLGDAVGLRGHAAHKKSKTSILGRGI